MARHPKKMYSICTGRLQQRNTNALGDLLGEQEQQWITLDLLSNTLRSVLAEGT